MRWKLTPADTRRTQSSQQSVRAVFETLDVLQRVGTGHGITKMGHVSELVQVIADT